LAPIRVGGGGVLQELLDEGRVVCDPLDRLEQVVRYRHPLDTRVGLAAPDVVVKTWLKTDAGTE